MKRMLLAACALAAAVLPTATAARTDEFDVIVANGRVIDGSGNPWIRADVGIRGKRIVAIGNLASAHAKRRIDAADKVVSPGFVDMHSHASWNYLVDPRAVSKVTQGVTLEIEGEGYSVAPIDDAEAERLRPQMQRFGVKPTWRSLDDFFRLLEAKPATINFASYVGTGTVRQLAVGFDDRPATPIERDKMRRIVEQAMRQGALGVYSALMYAPDRFNRTDELIDMARVAARYGGVYQTHQRSESDAISASMDEIIRIAREARIPAHITHLKVAYQQNWGGMPQLIKRIEQARASGIDITADMYPYERAAGFFTPLLPPWAQDGGREAIVRRLNDPATRARIKEEMARPAEDWENEFYGAGGGAAGITLIDARGSAALKKYQGRTVAEIAKSEGKDARDVVLDIVLAGDAAMTVLIASEQDIRAGIQQPWVAFGTDGETVAPDGPLSEGPVHPRAYGTLPRVFGTYVRELGLIRLEDAIRRATSLVAQTLNIRDRGLLREGYYADILVFDPAQFIDTATFEKPHQVARGMDYVIVNGEIVLDNGKITDARPGMVVRGPGYRRSATAGRRAS